MNPSNPFRMTLPTRFDIGQMFSAMSILTKHLAWDLGDRYDRHLGAQSPRWLEELAQERGDTFAKYDPTFVFAEPEFNHDSPTWQALGGWSDVKRRALERIRRTRNRWEHHAAELHHGDFKQGLQILREAALALGARSTVESCDILLARYAEIQRRGGALPTAGERMEALQQAREAAVAEAERKAAELAEAQQAAIREGRQREEAAARATEAQALLEEAKERASALEKQLFLAERERRVNTVEPADGLEPAQQWTGPLPTRTLHLDRWMRDLIDTESMSVLSHEFGPLVKEAADRWLEIMPAGGEVHLTPAGHGAGKVAGRFIYLGRLDHLTESLEDSVVLEVGANGELIDPANGAVVGTADPQLRVRPGSEVVRTRSGRLLDADAVGLTKG